MVMTASMSMTMIIMTLQNIMMTDADELEKLVPIGNNPVSNGDIL